MDWYKEENYVENFNLLGETVTIPKQRRFVDSNVRYYIDCINGNDDNAGDREHPFKTFNGLWRVASDKRFDTRCYLMTSGIYDIDLFSMCATPIHISLDPLLLPTNVTINFALENDDMAFYNGHINIQGAENNHITITGNFYTDGGEHLLKYCDLKCYTRFYGSGLLLERCLFQKMYLYNSQCVLRECTISNLNSTDDIIHMISSTLTIYGKTYVELTTDVSGSLFKITGSSLRLGSELNNKNTFKTNIGFDCEYSDVYSTRGRFNSILNVSNIKLEDASGSTFTGNWIYDTTTAVTGDTSISLNSNVKWYNTITLRIRTTGAYSLYDISNLHSESPSTVHIKLNDAEMDVSINGQTLTISNNTGIQLSGVIGHNI